MEVATSMRRVVIEGARMSVVTGVQVWRLLKRVCLCRDERTSLCKDQRMMMGTVFICMPS